MRWVIPIPNTRRERGICYRFPTLILTSSAGKVIPIWEIRINLLRFKVLVTRPREPREPTRTGNHEAGTVSESQGGVCYFQDIHLEESYLGLHKTRPATLGLTFIKAQLQTAVCEQGVELST